MPEVLFENIPQHIIDKINLLDFQLHSIGSNYQIVDLLQKTVLIGGKRLRPLLMYSLGDMLEVPIEKLIPFAKAVELVHAASLVHDDVIDNAIMRRGVPSLNIISSNKKAVIAGDYLLSSVMVDLSNTGNIKLVREMALTINQLVDGEWIQLTSSQNREYTNKIIEDIAFKKTASLMSFCTITPAYLKGCPENIIEHCRNFGENLGIAFQLVDDTLDFSSFSKKDNLLDLKNGTINSVIFDLLSRDESKLKNYKEGANLIELLDPQEINISLENIRKKAIKRLDHASEILKTIYLETSTNNIIHKNECRDLLISFIEYLKRRCF